MKSILTVLVAAIGFASVANAEVIECTGGDSKYLFALEYDSGLVFLKGSESYTNVDGDVAVSRTGKSLIGVTVKPEQEKIDWSKPENKDLCYKVAKPESGFEIRYSRDGDQGSIMHNYPRLQPNPKKKNCSLPEPFFGQTAINCVGL